jgi:hypothetical protein
VVKKGQHIIHNPGKDYFAGGGNSFKEDSMEEALQEISEPSSDLW